ncbi:MAG: ABC transporter permease, partial [Blastocatellia bacterium]|nr:ABC transporter permease [Blastocatellia bacterium]
MFADLRLAWRRLIKAPGFTVTAVMILTFAIGANAAVFSIADAALFRPLPYRDPDSLYLLRTMDQRTGKLYTLVPYRFLQAINQRRPQGCEVGIYEQAPSVTVVTNGEADSMRTFAVTDNYFRLFGIRPARGRLFDAGDVNGSGRPAMLSYATWQKRFGGDERMVGRPIKLGAITYDIVGILPSGFLFPSLFQSPLELVTVMPQPAPESPGGAFDPVLRLGPGVTREQAQAEIDTLIAPLAAENPQTANSRLSLVDVKSVLYPAGREIMTFLLAGSALVLLLGCASLAILFLARIKRSDQEIGIRIALGASRARLIRPLIFEAAIISAAGALIAILMTLATFDALLRQVPRIAYGNTEVGVDLRVIVFALSLWFLVTAGFSIVMAFRSTRFDAQALIQGRRQEVTKNGRFGRPLIAIQVALAIALTFATAIAGRAFLSVMRIPLGFNPDNVVTVNFRPEAKTGAERQAIYIRAIENAASQGEVISAGAMGSPPMSGYAPSDAMRMDGSDKNVGGIVHVLPGYFETISIPLLRGRMLNRDDARGGADVAVITDSAARILFPGRDPIGGSFSNSRGRRFTVIGVVANIRNSLDREPEPLAYVIPQDETRAMTLVIRAQSRKESTVAAIKRGIGSIAYGIPVKAEWWSDSIQAMTAYRNPRFQTLVFGTFAGLALLLIALGTFGVVSFSVAARNHELGVRLALGATPRSLVGMMVGQTLAPIAAGLILGLVLTRWLSKLAEAQLYKVKTDDPVMTVIAALVVVAVAVLAAYAPARRASRVDPLAVLRAE